MTILVAYGSKRGGTEGLANMVAEGLREEGLTAVVLPAAHVGAVEGYEVVIVGGALYASRWHKDARNFVRRNVKALRRRPTYLFSSGPLDDSATDKDIAPVKGVQRLIDAVGARGHVTFGGRLEPDAKGFPARAMAKRFAGDHRDAQHVRSWVHDVVAELRTRPRVAAAEPDEARRDVE